MYGIHWQHLEWCALSKKGLFFTVIFPPPLHPPQQYLKNISTAFLFPHGKIAIMSKFTAQLTYDCKMLINGNISSVSRHIYVKDTKEKIDFKSIIIKSHVLHCVPIKKYHNQQAFLLQLPQKEASFISACLLFPSKAGCKIQFHPKAMLPMKKWASLGKTSKQLTLLSDTSTAGNAASGVKR